MTTNIAKIRDKNMTIQRRVSSGGPGAWAFIILILFLLPFALFGYKYEVGIAAISRDEHQYLPEWIDYHHSIGVDHFYIYDNLSDPPYRKTFKNYTKKGIVTFIDYPYEHEDVYDFNAIQCSAYKHAIFNGGCKWIALIDTDEFIVPLKDDSIPQLLKRFDSCGAVGINWLMFGTSGVTLLPGESMLKKLTSCAPKQYPTHYHVKCIVMPEAVQDVINPHFCNLLLGWSQLNEGYLSFTGPFSPQISMSTVQINHYWTRDESFLQKKISRRMKFFPKEKPDQIIKLNREDLNRETNFSIQRFLH